MPVPGTAESNLIGTSYCCYPYAVIVQPVNVGIKSSPQVSKLTGGNVVPGFVFISMDLLPTVRGSLGWCAVSCVYCMAARHVLHGSSSCDLLGYFASIQTRHTF